MSGGGPGGLGGRIFGALGIISSFPPSLSGPVEYTPTCLVSRPRKNNNVYYSILLWYITIMGNYIGFINHHTHQLDKCWYWHKLSHYLDIQRFEPSVHPYPWKMKTVTVSHSNTFSVKMHYFTIMASLNE